MRSAQLLTQHRPPVPHASPPRSDGHVAARSEPVVPGMGGNRDDRGRHCDALDARQHRSQPVHLQRWCCGLLLLFVFGCCSVCLFCCVVGCFCLVWVFFLLVFGLVVVLFVVV